MRVCASLLETSVLSYQSGSVVVDVVGRNMLACINAALEIHRVGRCRLRTKSHFIRQEPAHR